MSNVITGLQPQLCLAFRICQLGQVIVMTRESVDEMPLVISSSCYYYLLLLAKYFLHVCHKFV